MTIEQPASSPKRASCARLVGDVPGVGKTYAMLALARSAKAEGRDVVV